MGLESIGRISITRQSMPLNTQPIEDIESPEMIFEPASGLMRPTPNESTDTINEIRANDAKGGALFERAVESVKIKGPQQLP